MNANTMITALIDHADKYILAHGDPRQEIHVEVNVYNWRLMTQEISSYLLYKLPDKDISSNYSFILNYGLGKIIVYKSIVGFKDNQYKWNGVAHTFQFNGLDAARRMAKIKCT